MNEAGETTSHLMGLFYRFVFYLPPFLTSSKPVVDSKHFYRTLRMVENDLKPCYVFDGKPPQLKSNVVSFFVPFFFFASAACTHAEKCSILLSDLQLKKRFSNRQEAKEDEVEAKEVGKSLLSKEMLPSSDELSG